VRSLFTVLVLSVLGGGAAAQTCERPVDPYDSGGVLDAERAAYDVQWYGLDVRVDPSDSTIAGRVVFRTLVVHAAQVVAFDLDTLLTIDSVQVLDGDGVAVEVARCGGRVSVALPRPWAVGEALVFTVAYHGRPRVAPRAPWDGGIVWARTAAGAPWIASANQMIGADVWWPMKDHVSDEPDSMRITVRVPPDLVAAMNGRLVSVDTLDDGWRAWHWTVSTPINAYAVALNIAPYVTIDTTIASVAGDSIPVVFYVLPEDVERGRALFPEILAHLEWFERRFGPYPFRADKYGVAQTPHLGMEHQSIIAYGAKFDNRSMTGGADWGFDALHHHELSHEWYGNLSTNADWKDMWLHEGTGTYTQVLWLEDTQGVERARAYLQSFRLWIRGSKAVAPRETTTAQGIYTDNDIYFKGAWVLHTLRWLIGDDAFLTAMRRLAYPTPESEYTVDGSAAHFTSTEEFRALAESLAGRGLSWFFDVYVHGVALPVLSVEREGDEVTLAWEVAGGGEFPLPVGISVDEVVRRVEMPGGRATISVPEGADLQIDPEGWLLMELAKAEATNK
jgi:aminopeptidase N